MLESGDLASTIVDRVIPLDAIVENGLRPKSPSGQSQGRSS